LPISFSFFFYSSRPHLYLHSFPTRRSSDLIEQFKFNVPNLPLFSTGEVPFLGDYIEVVPSPLFVPNGSSWSYNFTPSVNPLFHADRKSTRLNSSHLGISYAVFCLKKKKQ